MGGFLTAEYAERRRKKQSDFVRTLLRRSAVKKNLFPIK